MTPGRETTYFSPDRDDPNAPFMDRQLEIIRAAIRDRVSFDPADIPTMKNLKGLPTPEKYGGEDDSPAFMGWLKSLLRWLALGRITGPELDTDQVHLLGQYLVKEARLWYDDAIDNFDGVGSNWDFEQSVCALYRRFVHRSTARVAADQFQKVRYRLEAGVAGLWDELMTLARKMPTPPDDYSFKRRFVAALPGEVCVPMLRHRNVSIELSDAWELRRAALQQEDNNRALVDWQSTNRREV